MWQPIETAPKDGTWILITGGEGNWPDTDEVAPVVSAFCEKNYHGEDTWHYCFWEGGWYSMYENPTHWMPLPPLPEKRNLT